MGVSFQFFENYSFSFSHNCRSTVSFIDGAEHRSNAREKPQAFHNVSRSLPPGYICHRCNKPGHFISVCPTNGDPDFNRRVKRGGVGIPSSFLTRITEEGMSLLSFLSAIFICSNQFLEAMKSQGSLVMPDGSYYVITPMSYVSDRLLCPIFTNIS